ncbi:MAG: hypothetical protein PVG24_05210 [Gammaproteobacteria bacterium]|jgi:hypothetical protein
MNTPVPNLDPAAVIEAKGSINAEDLLVLRQSVFRDGVVDRAEAETIFRLDTNCSEKAAVWYEFYVDSLTDYFVWSAEPPKYVSEENAKFLIDHITHDGHIDGASELELLVNIVHWSDSVPEDLIVLMLQAVKDSVLTPDQAAYGRGRNAGVVTPADVLMVRRAIYAPGGGGSYTVTRREAEMIFDINNATVAADNDPDWQDLFVKAIANHLMFPRSAPKAIPADEYKRREAWLEERRGVGHLLADVGRNVASFNIMEGWESWDPFGHRAAEQRKAQDDARTQEALSRESIDEAEARWLLARMAQDDVLHENERALLKFIRDNSPNVHPMLAELFDQVTL